MSLDFSVSALIGDLHAAVAQWGGIEVVAAAETADALVVLFRRSDDADAVLEGVRVLGPARRSAADRRRMIADVLVEIVKDEGPAVRLKVPWADGLVADPAEVRWRGGAIRQSARLALRRLHTSAQGCEGLPL